MGLFDWLTGGSKTPRDRALESAGASVASLSIVWAAVGLNPDLFRSFQLESLALTSAFSTMVEEQTKTRVMPPPDSPETMDRVLIGYRRALKTREGAKRALRAGIWLFGALFLTQMRTDEEERVNELRRFERALGIENGPERTLTEFAAAGVWPDGDFESPVSLACTAALVIEAATGTPVTLDVASDWPLMPFWVESLRAATFV